MAINYDKGQTPKAPSNSTKMGATPGTQQTALNNVGGLNLNPNMPSGPQMQKRGRSSFQQSLKPTPSPAPSQPSRAGLPAPSLVGRPRTAPVRSTPVVSRMAEMDPGRGYNIFSGLDANQINTMNQSMGLSNMTALPSLVKSPAALPPGVSQGGQMRQVMSGEEEPTEFTNQSQGYGVVQNRTKYSYNPSTGLITYTVSGPGGDMTKTVTREEFLESYDEYGGDFDVDKQEENVQELISQVAQDYESSKTPEQIQAEQLAEKEAAEDVAQEQYFDDLPYELQEQQSQEYEGIDPAKKQEAMDNLDAMYASQLQQALAGIDRQASMMGTFGSGAHSTMLNNAVANALTQMSRDYNALNIMDIQAAELDKQQKVENAIKILGLDDAQTDAALNQFGKINQEVIAPIAAMISGYTSGGVAAGLTAELGDLALEVFTDMTSQGKSYDEIVAEIQKKGAEIVDKAQNFSYTG